MNCADLGALGFVVIVLGVGVFVGYVISEGQAGKR